MTINDAAEELHDILSMHLTEQIESLIDNMIDELIVLTLRNNNRLDTLTDSFVHSTQTLRPTTAYLVMTLLLQREADRKIGEQNNVHDQ